MTPEGHKASDETGNDPSKKVKYLCVRRERHGGAVIPRGAARWAWSDKDESLWIRCADGCCTTD